MKPIAYFGAIPFRALADRGLNDLDIRTLGVIAAHDNMSLVRQKGDGCWAGTDRIANLANANATNVSTCISKLERLGYLTRERHPNDGRRHTLRVVYDQSADKAAFKGDVLPEGKILALNRDLEKREASLPAEAKYLAQRPKVACPRPSIDGRNQPKPTPNIPEDTLNRPSDETAPTGVGEGSPKRNSISDGALLAIFERLYRGGQLGQHELPAWREKLVAIADAHYDEPNRGRAQRLLNEIDP